MSTLSASWVETVFYSWVLNVRARVRLCVLKEGSFINTFLLSFTACSDSMCFEQDLVI